METLFTNLEPAADKLPSQYGLVSYGTWCELECQRLGTGFYVKHTDDKVAIYTVKRLKEVKPE